MSFYIPVHLYYTISFLADQYFLSAISRIYPLMPPLTVQNWSVLYKETKNKSQLSTGQCFSKNVMVRLIPCHTIPFISHKNAFKTIFAVVVNI